MIVQFGKYERIFFRECGDAILLHKLVKNINGWFGVQDGVTDLGDKLAIGHIDDRPKYVPVVTVEEQVKIYRFRKKDLFRSSDPRCSSS